jgi:[acyl-carrier-protein] S-malonyltransferase
LATAVIFPAFVDEYSGMEEDLLRSYTNNFKRYLENASALLHADLTQFSFRSYNFLGDEERTQYMSYIFNCTVADILDSLDIKPSFVSGYSMGIYSALYYAGTVSFEDGLSLVKNAWDIISGITAGGNYGMGMIIGLEENDIISFLDNDTEICNRNNKHTFIVSGSKHSVENVLSKAKIEGALKASLLPVSNPYHSRILKDAPEKFKKPVYSVKFNNPEYSYLSALDQRIIQSGSDLRKEVIMNLSHKMNWQSTVETMIGHNTDLFFECGAGDGLTRNSRFIEGSYKSFSIAKIEAFLKAYSQR